MGKSSNATLAKWSNLITNYGSNWQYVCILIWFIVLRKMCLNKLDMAPLFATTKRTITQNYCRIINQNFCKAQMMLCIWKESKSICQKMNYLKPVHWKSIRLNLKSQFCNFPIFSIYKSFGSSFE